MRTGRGEARTKASCRPRAGRAARGAHALPKQPRIAPGQIDPKAEAQRDHEDEKSRRRASQGPCRQKETDAHGAEPDEGLNEQSWDHSVHLQGRAIVAPALAGVQRRPPMRALVEASGRREQASGTPARSRVSFSRRLSWVRHEKRRRDRRVDRYRLELRQGPFERRLAGLRLGAQRGRRRARRGGVRSEFHAADLRRDRQGGGCGRRRGRSRGARRRNLGGTGEQCGRRGDRPALRHRHRGVPQSVRRQCRGRADRHSGVCPAARPRPRAKGAARGVS